MRIIGSGRGGSTRACVYVSACDVIVTMCHGVIHCLLVVCSFVGSTVACCCCKQSDQVVVACAHSSGSHAWRVYFECVVHHIACSVYIAFFRTPAIISSICTPHIYKSTHPPNSPPFLPFYLPSSIHPSIPPISVHSPSWTSRPHSPIPSIRTATP